jgi:agmatine/peptidylarginine deiminase
MTVGKTPLLRIPLLSMLLLAVLLPASPAAQPDPPVRMCAEWEPASGTLIAWPLTIPSELVVELAYEDSLYVLIHSSEEQQDAEAAFVFWGIDLAHCHFILSDAFSWWTRDWGPHSMFDGTGEWGIIDPIFEGYPWIPGGRREAYMEARGWEQDDVVNADVAAWFGCQLHQAPFYLTGGNFMVDGHDLGYSTNAMMTENEQLWSPGQFLDLASEWLGLQSFYFTTNPESYGIQHIDCAAKLLDEETVMVKQVPEWHPDYWRFEQIAAEFDTLQTCYGRAYSVHRVFCDSYSGDETAAYTNAYILNGKMFVPTFDIASDTPALQAYEAAMPGYEVIGFYAPDWYYYDALHCRTREIMDRFMLLIWHRSLDQEMPPASEYSVEALIRAYSGTGLNPDETLLWWRTEGSPGFESVQLEPTGGLDSLAASIPGQPVGTVVHYYIEAADSSGRSETLPRTAPSGYFQFEVVETGIAQPDAPPPLSGLTVSPCPASGPFTVGFTLTQPSTPVVRLLDCCGRLVRSVEAGLLTSGHHSVPVNVQGLPSGLYIVTLEASGRFQSRSLVVLSP